MSMKDEVNWSPNSSTSRGSNDSSNTTEEERLKILFDSCDHDSDGYLDRRDFVFMCSRLNMAECADEIMQQLGLTNDRPISFHDFLHYKHQVMSESHHFTLEPDQIFSEPDRTDMLRMHRSNHQDIDLQDCVVTNKHDCWKNCDCKNVHDDNEVMIRSNVSSWLTMSSDNSHNSLGAQSGKPDSADYDSGARDLSPEPVTFTSVRCQGHEPSLTREDAFTPLDFSTRMQMSSRLKGGAGLGELTNHLLHLTSDRDILERKLSQTQDDCEDRIEQTVVRYEERITELHSVIAELRKKIERHNANVIQEEDEFEGESCKSDVDASSLDHSNSPSLDILSGAGFNQEIDDKFPEDDANIYMNLMNNLGSQSRLHTTCENNKTPPPVSTNQNAPLIHVTSIDRDEITRLRSVIENISDDRERLKNKIKELQISPVSPEDTLPQRSSTPSKQTNSNVHTPTSRPLSKMAELKRLKSPSFSESSHLDHLSSPDASTSYLNDLLTQHLPECHSTDDLVYLINRSSTQLSQNRLSELNLENQRLSAHLERLKSETRVTELTLEESRSQSDRLSVLIGKYESNNTALQLGVAYSDQALEVYDVLCAYIEAEQGLLLANCRAAGLGVIGESSDKNNQAEITSVLQQAQMTFNSTNNLAKQLIHKLERSTSKSHIGPPWDDTNSTLSSTASSSDIDGCEKLRLRDYITQLKSDRLSVNMTVMELESIHIDPRIHVDIDDTSTLDLEHAVLMQDLMATKEEKAELKAHNYLLEKEKRALELKLCGKESREKAYVVQIDQLKSELGEKSPNLCELLDSPPSSRDSTSRPIAHEHDLSLSESVKRERKLKQRVQELVGTMEKLSRNSETRHQQSSEFIGDLKRANSALISAFEKAKKKYQSKIKKLESHLENVTETSFSQISQLKQRISQLETDSCGQRLPNETSL